MLKGSSPTAKRGALATTPSYWDENWATQAVPARWSTEVTTPGQASLVTYAFPVDPIGEKGAVLRFRCQYDSTLTTDYTGDELQLVSLFRGAQDAHSGYLTVNEETWYRQFIMIPSPNVFCNGNSNWLIEWHVDPNTQSLGGNSPGLMMYGGFPLTSGGTSSPPGFVLRWSSGTPATPTYTYWPSADGSGAEAQVAPLAYTANQWIDMKWRVIWSTSATVGRVEWWVNGVQRLARTMATQYTNANNFNSQSFHTFGLYDYRYNVTGDSTVYFDRCVAGPSEASVA